MPQLLLVPNYAPKKQKVLLMVEAQELELLAVVGQLKLRVQQLVAAV